MSENFDELGELGDKIKKIIDTAVSTKDYRQMTEDIKQTVGQTVNSAVNSAVDSGSEAIKNGLNNVFGTGNSQSGDFGVYRNKTKEFEEKRRREREQEQERQRIEKEKAKEKTVRKSRLQNRLRDKRACHEKTNEEKRYFVIGVTWPSTYQVRYWALLF